MTDAELPLFAGLDADPEDAPEPPEPETYTVSALCGEIRELLAGVFPSVWVAGEVARAHLSRRGHLYFELVEKGEDDAVCGKLDCVVWSRDHQRLRRLLADSGQEIREGVELRCRGRVDFYGAGGRLQLVVREIDPLFTLGLLERRRRETLAALAASGLLEANRALPFPALPLSIALVTSHGSAAYHDFLATLSESGFAFRVRFVHASVQGASAEREVVSALASLARLPGGTIDLVALVRGGGSRTDLAAFDSRGIAEAIARSAVPVVTGLGHEIDRAIADLVAHTAAKTPTKVAELLVERAAAAERRAEELAGRLGRAARERLAAGHEALGRAERGVEVGRFRLASAAARLDGHARALASAARATLAAGGRRGDELARRLAAAAPRRLTAARPLPESLGRHLVAASRARLREEGTRLDGLSRLAVGLGPERTLGRGYSVTRTASGKLLTRAEETAAGERIVTRLAHGELTSRVERIGKIEQAETTETTGGGGSAREIEG